MAAIIKEATHPCSHCVVARNPYVDRARVAEIGRALGEAKAAGDKRKLFALRKRFLGFGATGRGDP